MAPRRASTRLSTGNKVATSSPEPIFTAPQSRRGRPRKTPLKKEIPDSDEEVISVKNEIPESDEVEPSLMVSPPTTKTQFRGVFVPLMTATDQTRSSTASTAPSSIADSLDDKSDYNTPDTSAMTTPAASVVAGKQRATTVTATARAAQLSSSKLSLGRKRSRPNADLDDFDLEGEDSADAKIAARLQAEEYAMAEDSDDEPLAKRQFSFKMESDSEDEPLVKRRRVIADVKAESDDEDSMPGPSSRTVKTRALASRVKIETEAAPRATSELTSLDSLAATESTFDDSESELGSIATEDIEDMEDGTTVVVSSRSRSKRKRGALQAAADDEEWDWTNRRQRRERKRLEKAHPEIVTMWDDLADVSIIKPVPAEQPSTINRKLKPFQLEGLDWMKKQEKSQWKGGLLGDEMGMGKTIQAVSLIMSDYPAKQPSLVVVPPVALMQWQAEINDYTSGKLKVLVYHISANPKCKLMTTKDLQKYDVIMVSYSGLESMYRKENKGWNRNDGLVKEDSILHAIHYHRLILDEAHSIKQRTTSVAKACFALKSDFKWCLSGTPVQNRIGEFFSLLRFLELVPFACYFCKQCPCKELHWSQNEKKMCNTCGHSGFHHVSVFNQEILNPITQSGSDSLRKKGLSKLRLITDRIMLRRVKRDHTSSMELPPKDVIIHNEFFGEIERDFSQSIMSNSERKFETYVAQGVMLNNYANIFGLIMQMRQVANHPDLILRRHAEGGQNVIVCCICDDVAEEPIRSKCRHEFCRECAKTYVQACSGSDADCPKCHIALAIDWEQPDIEQDEDHVSKSSIINRIKMDDWTSSTKIEMLIYDLYKLRSKKQTHKSIVFSQFTSMLQLVQWRLQKSGFSTVLLDGSMSPAQRQKSIEHFMNNVDVEVFLVSLKAGGVALNLTEASRVFIIDPWWNPAAEWQSADRCHRIGQRRPCVITRLCIEDSVESRMVLLQEKKANMINGTVNNDQVALDKLTPEDMQFLFRGS